MRYDQTALYFTEEKELTSDHYDVNITSLGAEKQAAIFGDLAEERVTIRMREQTDYLPGGYFKIGAKSYRILKRSNVQKGTSYYGAEYNGRL